MLTQAAQRSITLLVVLAALLTLIMVLMWRADFRLARPGKAPRVLLCYDTDDPEIAAQITALMTSRKLQAFPPCIVGTVDGGTDFNNNLLRPLRRIRDAHPARSLTYVLIGHDMASPHIDAHPSLQ